jgi:hexosaminidase
VPANVTVNNNAGTVVVKANNIFGTLACSGNVPAPTNAGQPNTAASKTGQCVGL